MKAHPLIALILLTAACTREGDAFECSSEETTIQAVAVHDRISGKLLRYEGTDMNGISVRVDAQNSKDFACTSEKALAEGRRQHEAECKQLAKSGEIENHFAECIDVNIPATNNTGGKHR